MCGRNSGPYSRGIGWHRGRTNSGGVNAVFEQFLRYPEGFAGITDDNGNDGCFGIFNSDPDRFEAIGKFVAVFPEPVPAFRILLDNIDPGNRRCTNRWWQS